MKMLKYAFDAREDVIRENEAQQKLYESREAEVEEYMYNSIVEHIVELIDASIRNGRFDAKCYINLPDRFFSDESSICHLLREMWCFRNLNFGNKIARRAIDRVRTTLKKRGYYILQDHLNNTSVFSCYISWERVKKTNRTLRGLCRVIIVLIRYRDDYYKPGSNGVNTLKRNFESLIKQS